MLITSKSFAGGAGIASGTLSDAIRGIAIHTHAVAASAIDDLTDNSGGTSGATAANLSNFTLSAVTGSNAVAKAEAETAYDGVLNGLSNIIEQANAIRAVVPAFETLVDSTGGTAGASSTIAAIDVSATGAGSALMSASGANDLLAILRARMAQAVGHVNALAEATGQTKLTLSYTTEYVGSYGVTYAAVSTDTGTAVDGSDTTAANACVLKTEWDASMTILANTIASMAATLNAITADANANHVLDVVAG